VVVEAAFKSGSLITARLAGDYGREVMAVPGSPLDPRSHGCNEMIREGAILVQRAEDIIELISSFDGVPRSHFHEDGEDGLFGGDDLGGERTLPGGDDFAWGQTAPAPDEAETRDAQGEILALLSLAPVSVDEILRQTGLPTGAVQMALVELELSGEVLRHAGGRISRAVV
jgi:DNA processing protein